ncbi:MAG: YdhR family protein [Acidobacteriota bacterium]
MSIQILQINFRFNVSRAEYEEVADELAQSFADLSGLRWKIWLMNEAESEAGGIYLFEDETSVQSFLNGPLATQVTSHPAISDFSVKTFDVMSFPTEIADGPV